MDKKLKEKLDFIAAKILIGISIVVCACILLFWVGACVGNFFNAGENPAPVFFKVR